MSATPPIAFNWRLILSLDERPHNFTGDSSSTRACVIKMLLTLLIGRIVVILQYHIEGVLVQFADYSIIVSLLISSKTSAHAEHEYRWVLLDY